MIIVLSLGNCLNQPDDAYAFFIKSVVGEWVQLYQHHTYYVISSAGVFPDDFPSGDNIKTVSYAIENKLFGKWLWRNRLASLIKKVKAEAFFSFDGSYVHNKHIAQCLVFSNISTGKKLSRKGIDIANSIIVLSQSAKDQLIKAQIAGDKITIVYGAAEKSNCCFTEEEKMAIKEKYTEGSEFFIYKGLITSDKNIISLLKAFSLFKKRQKSSMKLVITGSNRWPVAEWEKLLSTYKHRDDILMANKMEKSEQEQLFCSAYAFVYPSSWECMIVFGLDAMKCGIPVLTNKNLPLKEIGDEAALYFDVEDAMDIADKMMLIYKDEALRSRLIEKAKAIAETFTWHQAATTIWQSMYPPKNN